ncbi:hypothetical protein WAI453_013277 [Rhynchosporium graminicola]
MVLENEPLMQHHQYSSDTSAPISTHEDVYNDNDDISSSLSPPRNPITSVETDDELNDDFLDLENGYSITKGDRDWTRENWWGVKDIMTIRSRERRKGSPDSIRSAHEDEGRQLLEGKHIPPSRRRTWTWLNYCIFRGISGLAITAILLTINLLLLSATFYWNTDPDEIFRSCGGVGSGTEGLNWYPTDFTRDIQPIACHSHNDYWRRVPLFSALRHGCIGVEADVWLYNDDLLVGHNTASLQRSRTFRSLYIDPLVKILENANQKTDFHNGTSNGVFDVDPEQSLTLLIDVKTDGNETWGWVLKQLEPLRERGWLTFVEGDVVHKRSVTVVGTGNARFDVLTENETYRDAFFDAPLDTMWEPASSSSDSAAAPSLSPSELGSKTATNNPSLHPNPDSHDQGQGLSGTTASTDFNAENSYYASVSLGKAIGHIWFGELSSAQLEIIRGQVRGAHSRGLKARYWDLPAWPRGLRNHVWKVLVDEGVDILNVDDLMGVKRELW